MGFNSGFKGLMLQIQRQVRWALGVCDSLGAIKLPGLVLALFFVHQIHQPTSGLQGGWGANVSFI